MALAHPWTLLLLGLSVVVVWLYGRPVPARRVAVGLGPLWQQALAAEPRRAAWQRWRGPVSLAVQLLLLGLVVLAAADPQIPGPRRLVVIVDNSPSMSARDVKPTRLDEARRLAKLLASRVRPVDRLAVVAAADGPSVCCTPTSEPAVLAEAIESIRPGTGCADIETALELARKMLAREGGGRIVIFTDGCCPPLSPRADDLAVDVVVLGQPADNLAVTRLGTDAAMASARTPSGAWEVLVELGNFADHAATCRLTLAMEGRSLATQPATPMEIQLEPRGRAQRVFRIAAAAPGRLTAQIQPLGGYEDMLPEDNMRSIVLGPEAAAGSQPCEGIPKPALAEKQTLAPRQALPAGGDAPAQRAQGVGAAGDHEQSIRYAEVARQSLHEDHEQSVRDLQTARQFLNQEAMIWESDLTRTRFGLRESDLPPGDGMPRRLANRPWPLAAAKFHLLRTPDEATQVASAFAGGISLRPALLVAALLLAAMQWCLEQRRWLV